MNSVESLLREKIAARIEEEKKRVAAAFWEEVDLGEAKAAPGPHPLHKTAIKHGYTYSGPGTTTTGGDSTVTRHEYHHPKSGHTLTLGNHHKNGNDQHFWTHDYSVEGSKHGQSRRDGVTSQHTVKRLRGTLNNQLKKTTKA
jgi:hypothetical protein